MKKIIRLVITGGIIGSFIGFNIAVFCSLIFKTTYFVPSSPYFVLGHSSFAVLVSELLWILIGVVFAAANRVFTIEKWSITRQTITHFLITYILFTPIAVACGWFPLTFHYLFWFTVEFIAIYIIIWFGCMIKTKYKVNKLNKTLKQNK